MCRFIAYLGKPILLHDILFKPKNSLIRQSIHARESNIAVNGDGFGLGWYQTTINAEPALFTSIQPAWNDRNLDYLTQKIITQCFFAHVRAASLGGVSQFNCHPFHYGCYCFMHNGGIANFQKSKRHLRHLLDDDIYAWVKGQTDSEHLFALFLQNLKQQNFPQDIETLAQTLETTVMQIDELQQEFAEQGHAHLNLAITDNQQLLALHYTSDRNDVIPTLYYAAGEAFCYAEDACHITPAKDKIETIIIASEKLNNFNAEWHSIPVNTMLLVDADKNISQQEIL